MYSLGFIAPHWGIQDFHKFGFENSKIENGTFIQPKKGEVCLGENDEIVKREDLLIDD